MSAVFDVATYVYSRAPRKREAVDLHADLYLPIAGGKPVPLMVWIHAGGFRTGSRESWTHEKMAHYFVEEGYAFAAIDYRLARPPAILSRKAQAILPKLVEDGEAHCPDLNPSFRAERPVAVVEDIASFFDWIGARCEQFGLSGEYLLGGASAGGLSALNALFLSPALGKALPPIRSCFVLSGGFAFPSLMGDAKTPILAVHNPSDDRVDFSAIALMKELRPKQVELIVAHQQRHGFPMLTPEEPMAAGVGRFISFDRRMKKGQSPRVSPVILDAPEEQPLLPV